MDRARTGAPVSFFMPDRELGYQFLVTDPSYIHGQNFSVWC